MNSSTLSAPSHLGAPVLEHPEAVAVIGMAGRFPQSPDVEAFWQHLAQGHELIQRFSADELRAAGFGAEQVARPGFIGAASVLEDADAFDADFFKVTAAEAELMDPQHRVFLECCWHAMENAGYAPGDPAAGEVGVYAGCGISTYMMAAAPRLTGGGQTSLLQLLVGNDKDYLATRVSYKLRLTGPSVCVQSACSTSLLAVHMAAQSVLAGECTMALAGGADISVPQTIGYEYQAGMIFSPDGHCRAFDAKAGGTVAGNGAGVVLLKRLDLALRDGDTVLAVLRGSAVNNDGADKIGYTAPSVAGQARVIAQALAVADVSPDSIGYVEAHGTGTELGDPIEVHALERAFRGETRRTGFCALGSVKTNIGHLNAAAGIASFIKTVLALRHRAIPPSLHYTQPNPKIDFARSPFFVNAELRDWEAGPTPRRAGVSSFGFGGTNVHVILEEAPTVAEVAASQGAGLMLLSAHSEAQLRTLADSHAAALEADDAPTVRDACHTALAGRRHDGAHRLALVGLDRADLAAGLRDYALLGEATDRASLGIVAFGEPQVAALFTGQGAQYAGMAAGLYGTHAVFREALDACAQALEGVLQQPLAQVLFGEHTALLERTDHAQPAMFAVEYALYRTWSAAGVRFRAVAGHSLGEFVAACVAGVMSLPDALKLVAARGRLTQSIEGDRGRMLAVLAEEPVVRAGLRGYERSLSIAAINGPRNLVVAGDSAAVERFRLAMEAQGVSTRPLLIADAFHSPRMDPVLDDFERIVAQVPLQAPRMPVVSNLHGRVVADDEITRPRYWRDHLREPVLFAAGVQCLVQELDVRVLLECGPHPVLSRLAADCVGPDAGIDCIASLQKDQDDQTQFLLAAGRLYTRGVMLEWKGLTGDVQARRVPLPGYPFARQRYWLAAVDKGLHGHASAPAASPAWEALLSAGRAQADAGLETLGLETLRAHEELLLAHARASVLRALDRLALFAEDGQPHAAAVLAQRGAVQPRFHQLLERLLHALADAGELKRDADGVFGGFAPPDDTRMALLAARCEPVWAASPHFKPVFLQAADQLAAVLAGKTSGLEAMLGNDSLTSAEGIYADLPTSRYFNALVSEVVRAWVGRAGTRPLRVLEIGAGTGATTRQVLPHLPASRTEYVFSDVSPLFLDRAAARFADQPFVRYQLFDIDRAPASQGLEPGSFDLVLASNVLHAAADLRATMANVRDLLRPSGVLVMYEIVRETLIGEITTGLLLPVVRDTGLRGIQPFMDEAQWHGLLDGLGFDAQASFPEASCAASALGERVLVARRAETAEGHTQAATPMRTDAPVYRRTWQLHEAAASTAQEEPGHWFIVSDASGVGKALADALQARGHHVERIAPDEAYALGARLRSWVRRKDGSPGRVVHLRGIDGALDAQTTGTELRAHQEESLGDLLRLLGALGEADVQALGQLGIVTRGAQAVAAHEAPMLAQAPLWGFSQVAALGHPELHIELLDLDPVASARESAQQLMAALLQGGSETECALRAGRRLVPRLHRHPVPLAAPQPLACDPSATYLIAGGLGGLGLETARWLAAHGARHLVLAGRRAPGTAAIEVIDALKGKGIDVQVAQTDLRDEAALRRTIDALPHPLKGVVHCAVVTDAAQLGELPPLERALEVMAPKVEGAWNLHRATEGAPLDFFILYSSSVSLVPARGLPDYVAGNAFLDALAGYRQARGMPALSVSWGAWSDVGTVADSEQLKRLERGGLRSFTPAGALELLALAMASGEPHLGVFDVDWPVLLRGHPAVQLEHYFQPVAMAAGAKALAGRSDIAEAGDVRAALEAAPDEAAREQLLRMHLQQTVGRLLRRAPADIPPDADLLHLGIDSLMFLDLTHRLGQALGLQIRPNELMAEMNVAAMARKLAAATGNGATTADTPASLLQPRPDDAALPFELTDVQQAYWIGRHQDMALGSVACHGYMELDCEDLDRPLLATAWRDLVARHEMLRCLIEADGMQRILASVPAYEIADIDLRGDTPAARQARLDAVRGEMSHRVPRTDRWPLFDIRTSRLDARRTRLHISLDNIMTDGRSIGILLSEWVARYARPEQPLPPLGLGFRDYTQAVQRHRQTAEHARARDYWVQRLEDMPPAPQLPLAKDPAQIASPRFHRREFNLPPEAWQRLRQRGAERAGLTPSGLLLAVYAEVLGRWSASPRLTLNVPTFNRLPVHPQVNDIVGEFTSLILLAVDGDATLSFAARARQLQQQLLRDQAHDSFTGVQVMREIARREGAQRAAMPVVFTSTFGLAEQADTGHAEREQQATRLGDLVYTISQTPQVWIDNHVHDHGGRLNVCWDSVDELFPEGLLDAMFGAYCALLRDLAAESDATWGLRAPVALPTAQQDRRDSYNATADAMLLRAPTDLLAPFRQSVSATPQRAALIAGEDTFSYRALHEAAQWVGWRLRNAGVQPGERVAIVAPKGWQQVVGVIGAMAAGAAYVPIDPQWPDARRHELLAVCGIRHAIVGAHDAALAWPTEVEVLAVPDARVLRECSAEAQGFAWHEAQGSELAYIIFTSGSTGLPKGVMIDHRGALNTVLDINRRFDIGAGDAVFGLSALSFDLSVHDIFGSFAAGACLVLPEAEGLRDAQHWLELIERHGVTVWNSVPALCQMLVEQAGARAGSLRSLRTVMLSGDWIPLSLPDALRAAAPQARLIGLGGATEASIWSIHHRVDGVQPDWRSIPYGTPLANQRFHVLDAALRPCPEWVVGELYIGGVGLALGYWADTARTEAAFVVHPDTGERLYRTGDLGRFHPRGYIEFLGRRDHQVKVNGYRIELGEIESALRAHEAVGEALVLAIGADGGRSRAGAAAQRKQSLAAYVVAADGAARIERDALRDFLRTRIPEYMVPSEVIVLERLPLSANGKVDRAALPALQPQPVERESLPPVTPAERALAAEWGALLSLTSVDRRDHFFELGGDSLLATRLCVRMKERHGIALSVRQVFANPELEAMAACVVAPVSGPRELVVRLSPGKASAADRHWFGFHGSDGDVFVFRPMAEALRQLDANAALHGLQSPLDPPLTIEAMAHTYVHALREVQPQGPYRLCGFSSGGVLAWEAACQLRDAGETVERLLLVDTALLPSALIGKPLATLALFAASLGVPAASLPWLEGLAPLPGANPSEEALAAWLTQMPHADNEALHMAVNALAAGEGREADDLRARFAMFRHHVEAVARHVPRELDDVAVTFLHATQGVQADAAAPWRGLCDRLVSAGVPGDHFSCMQTAQVAQWVHHLMGERAVEEVLS
ncbi:non-ribosomal peptide synthetase/type I polyketide synthase [Variovorax boronicumulans]|uniref:non-ribosomal peptide synthetase/type I polyketide synthase n=1 Tax=Variovorax boronicumulans TaxID=436515 RepID=UPI0033996580